MQKIVRTCNSTNFVWIFASFAANEHGVPSFGFFCFPFHFEFRPDKLHYRKRHLVSAASQGPQGTSRLSDLKSVLDLAMGCSSTMALALAIARPDTKQCITTCSEVRRRNGETVHLVLCLVCAWMALIKSSVFPTIDWFFAMFPSNNDISSIVAKRVSHKSCDRPALPIRSFQHQSDVFGPMGILSL